MKPNESLLCCRCDGLVTRLQILLLGPALRRNSARFFFFSFFSRCRKSALLRRWLVRARGMPIWEVSFSAKYEIMVLACQVGPFHLTLTQINWEMNCITKNKCTNESQNIDFFVFALFYVIQEKRQKILLSQWNKVLFCRVFVCVVIRTRPIGDSINKRTKYSLLLLLQLLLLQMCSFSLYFCVTFILNKLVSFCRMVVFIL